MIRVAIVDDEFLAIDRLTRLCERLPDVEIAGTARDALAALALVETSSVDVVLLDIRMPGADGLSLAGELAARGDGAPAVVFVTAHADFAVAAFELAATDYLLKPISLDRLQRALQRAADRAAAKAASADNLNSGSDRNWWIPDGGELTRLKCDDLEMVSAERDYVRLHTRRKSYLLRETMTTIERSLDQGGFLRVHRSTIVRRDAIEAVCQDAGRWTLRMTGGASVPVGRNYLPRVRAELFAATASPSFKRRVRQGTESIHHRC